MSRWVSLCAVLLLPLVAIADDPKQQPIDREKLLKSTPEEFIKTFDKNNDGLLTADELPPPLARAFEKADRNGDGKLDVKEVGEMLKVLRERAANNPNQPAKPDVDKVVANILERL